MKTTKFFTRAALALAAGACVAVMASPASAAPAADPASAAPHATAWNCAGDVCIRFVPQGAITPLNASGCNGDTCINVVGSASGYSAVGFADDDYFGHVDLWGPGMPFRNGPEGRSPTVSGSGGGVGSACAQGWEATGGGNYRSRGLPCVSVR